MKNVFGAERMVTIARELTKTFETIKQDTLGNLVEWISASELKGEFVIVVHGASSHENTFSEDEEKLKLLLENLLSELSVKQAVSIACKITGLNRKIVYAAALRIKDK